jgi:cytidylate kinase
VYGTLGHHQGRGSPAGVDAVPGQERLAGGCHVRAAEAGARDVEATRDSLLARDRIDSSRAASPLVMAEGAVHIDGTAYTLDEVIDLVVSLVEARETVS